MSVHLSIFLFLSPNTDLLWFEPFFFSQCLHLLFFSLIERKRQKEEERFSTVQTTPLICLFKRKPEFLWSRNSMNPEEKKNPKYSIGGYWMSGLSLFITDSLSFFFFLNLKLLLLLSHGSALRTWREKRTVFGSVVRDPVLLSWGHPLAPAGASNANDRTGNLSKQGSKVPNRKAQTPFKRIQAQTTQIYIRPEACPPDMVEQESEIRQIFISSDTHTRTFGLSRWSKLVYFWQAFLLHKHKLWNDDVTIELEGKKEGRKDGDKGVAHAKHISLLCSHSLPLPN